MTIPVDAHIVKFLGHIWCDTTGIHLFQQRHCLITHLGFGDFKAEAPGGLEFVFIRADHTQAALDLKEAGWKMEGRPHYLTPIKDVERWLKAEGIEVPVLDEEVTDGVD